MIPTQDQVPPKVIHIQAADFDNANKIGSVSKIRPYRKGGIRLQHEEVQEKHIFHNYGHGSATSSLAYGSVFLSVKSISTYMKPGKYHDCAVIGSGLIAMLTAVQLARNGHAPIVYADSFANFEETNLQKLLTSQIDEGLVLPSGYDSSNRLLHELLIKMSYEYYKDCIKVNRYQSMKQVLLYQRDMTIPQFKQQIPGFIYNNYKSVNLSIQNGASQPYTRAKVVKINTKLFMQQLKIQGFLRGVQYIQTKFNNLQDVLSLNENVIFNCSGYSSKYLFNDENMIGSKSHFVVYKNPSNLKYTVGAQVNDRLHIRIHCDGGSIVVRADSALEESDNQIIQQIVSEAKNFVGQKSKNVESIAQKEQSKAEA